MGEDEATATTDAEGVTSPGQGARRNVPSVTDIGSHAAPTLPPSVRTAIRSLSVDQAIAETVPLLGAAGVRCILLKGPSHARWLYDRPDERTYTDCDLLVAPDDADRAEAVLGDAGFVRRGFEAIPTERQRFGFPLYRTDNVSVDLHTTFIGVGAPPERLWACFSDRIEPMIVAGASVMVLEPTARALVLVLHAAKEGGRREGRGEKPIRDLELAVERIPFDDWRRSSELAVEVDAVEAFSAGLRRISSGRELADHLGLTDRLSPEVALRLEQPPPLAVGMDWLLYSEQGTRGLRLALRKVFPPPAHMRAWSPLARRGRWGLALAYIGRPIWVAWKFIPAIFAVRRARRAAGR